MSATTVEGSPMVRSHASVALMSAPGTGVPANHSVAGVQGTPGPADRYSATPTRPRTAGHWARTASTGSARSAIRHRKGPVGVSGLHARGPTQRGDGRVDRLPPLGRQQLEPLVTERPHRPGMSARRDRRTPRAPHTPVKHNHDRIRRPGTNGGQPLPRRDRAHRTRGPLGDGRRVRASRPRRRSTHHQRNHYH